ncbi:MAG: hypothetical protein RLY83_438 [Actinomycetota bacterium]
MNDLTASDLIGPFDSTEVPSTLGYLSFGSILMPTIEGVSVRAEVDEATNAIVAVSFEHNESVLQVSVFSAAKSEELWPEIYQQLFDTISGSGGKVSETIGGFGKQLDAVVVANGVTREVRFIGFDGPRWFLRGAITGPALADANAAMNMEDIFRSLVIDRGTVPLPPREPLPLKVPDGNFVPPKFGI